MKHGSENQIGIEEETIMGRLLKFLLFFTGNEKDDDNTEEKQSKEKPEDKTDASDE